MTDQGAALSVMRIFEAGAKLHSPTETVCLASHLYHRFLRVSPQLMEYELVNFAAACVRLAYTFFESPLEPTDLALVMTSVTHGPKLYLDSQSKERLVRTIDFAAKIISIHLNFELNFKNSQRQTPGQLMRAIRDAIPTQEPIIIDESEPEEQPFDQIAKLCDDEQDKDIRAARDEAEKRDREEEEKMALLAANSKHSIGAHRYLLHYLTAIGLLVDPISMVPFRRVCNVAWSILSDFHWSPSVTMYTSSSVACVCLMMAIEACRKELDCNIIEAAQLWRILNKKWNLILCDDLTNNQAIQIENSVINQYDEYERVLEHELMLYVIDPKSGERGISKARNR